MGKEGHDSNSNPPSSPPTMTAQLPPPPPQLPSPRFKKRNEAAIMITPNQSVGKQEMPLFDRKNPDSSIWGVEGPPTKGDYHKCLENVKFRVGRKEAEHAMNPMGKPPPSPSPPVLLPGFGEKNRGTQERMMLGHKRSDGGRSVPLIAVTAGFLGYQKFGLQIDKGAELEFVGSRGTQQAIDSKIKISNPLNPCPNIIKIRDKLSIIPNNSSKPLQKLNPRERESTTLSTRISISPLPINTPLAASSWNLLPTILASTKSASPDFVPKILGIKDAFLYSETIIQDPLHHKHCPTPWRGRFNLNNGKSDKSDVELKHRMSKCSSAEYAKNFHSLQFFTTIEFARGFTHVRDIIQWGVVYFLKPFNFTIVGINQVVVQVKNGDTTGYSSTPNDHTWELNIDQPRTAIICSTCPGLVADITAAFMFVSMFLKDNRVTQRTLWADRRKRRKNATETRQTKHWSVDNYLEESSLKSATKSAKGKDEIEQEKKDLEQFKATVETKVNFKNLGKKGAEFFLVISKNNEDDPKFNEVFSQNLKLKTHGNSTIETKSVELFRHHSSTSSDKMIRFKDYVTRREVGPIDIHYFTSKTKKDVENYWFPEKLKREGYEVPYLVDTIDECRIGKLKEIEMKKLVAATSERAKLEEMKVEQCKQEKSEGYSVYFHELLMLHLQVTLWDALGLSFGFATSRK